MEMTRVMSQLIETYKTDLTEIRQELDLLWLEHPGDKSIPVILRKVNSLIERMS